MVHVDFTTERMSWCVFCRMNKHSDCDHHMNDGAGDANDFIPFIKCSCPCKGMVYTSLIDLVKDQNNVIARLRVAADRLEEQDDAATRVLSTVNSFLDSIYDDEGNVLHISKNRNADLALVALVDELTRLAQKEQEQDDA